MAGLRAPDGVPGLLLEVDADAVPGNLQMPSSKGFDLDVMLIGHSQAGRVRLALSLSDDAYATVFDVLCRDTAGAASIQRTDREAVTAFVGRLAIWQDFMSRHGHAGLSQEGTLGLFGELHILETVLAVEIGWSEAVASWVGPRSEPNDFSLRNGFLEVKATTQQAPSSLFVSNADQLDPARGTIGLAYLRFRPVPDGHTLPELVASIRTQLQDVTTGSRATFDTLLVLAGYLDEHAEIYDTRLLLEQVDFYEVTEMFPHLGRADLMAGVKDCRYTVDLEACVSHRVSRAFVTGLTGRGGV